MRVKDVMTRSVETVSPDSSLQETAERMKSLDVGPMPVCESDRLVGMITDRDITVRAVAQGFGASMGKVRDVMTSDVVFCRENDSVAQAAQLMKIHQIRRLVVMDDNDRLVGIVSLGDLAVDGEDEHVVAETLEKVSEHV